MATAGGRGAAAKKVRKKEKKNVVSVHAHIKSTFNNTVISITDPTGAVRRRSARSGPSASRSARSPTSPPFRTTAAARPSGVASRPRPERTQEFMARYTGPMTKKSRRLGVDLVGADKAFERRPYPPGVHGKGRTKESEYSLQLREKQKARFSYGVLEKQFRRYYEEANRLQGKTGDNLLQILESRLDNVVYRAGLARTRRQARQFVVHGHFLVNGKKVDIPSFRVSRYDIIDVKPKS